MNLKIKRYNTTNKIRRKAADVFFITTALAFFAAMGAAMLLLPRSSDSVLEQRELAELPEYSAEAFKDGSYSAEMDAYFSDTVPFRDNLMVLSSALTSFTGFRSNNIKLHNVSIAEADKENEMPHLEPMKNTDNASDNANENSADGNSSDAVQGLDSVDPAETDQTIQPVPSAQSNTDDTVNITNNGIAVVGTRALMLYGGNFTVGEDYAKVISQFKQELGRDVNVYSMVIPTSVEFYCPEDVKSLTSSQLDNINNIYSHLTNGVKAVDAYTSIAMHTDEPIYLRTDHHWSSLGAYYAAGAFAEAAGVPFAELSEYDEHVIDGYVGTMYSYTQDIAIKNNPEDFVYYVPKNVTTDTTYQNYILGENNVITGIGSPLKSSFYIDFTKNKSMLYCTFMGGDAKITHVNTSTKNGRKLAIFKDSYGNALPQFLFGSFEDIYVLDMRYFTYNAIDYLKEKGITDVLFANNAFHATTRSTVRYYENFLVQGRVTEETAVPDSTAVNGTVTQSTGKTDKTGSTTVTSPPNNTSSTNTSNNTTRTTTTSAKPPASEPAVTTVPTGTKPATTGTTAPSQTKGTQTTKGTTKTSQTKTQTTTKVKQTEPPVTTSPTAKTTPPTTTTVPTGTTPAQSNR